MVRVSDKAKLTASTSKRPHAAVYGKKPVLNSKFKKRGIAYSRKVRGQVCNRTLRRLEQPPYQEVMLLTQAKAKAFLKQHGVLPANKQTFFCWSCGEQLHMKEGVGRCNRRKCDNKSRLHDTAHVYTPLASHARAGYEADYVCFLRCAYMLGCKIPADAGVHMVRRPDETPRAAEHRLYRYTQGMKVALAYDQLLYSRDLVFKDEIVEPDSGRMGSKKTSTEDATKKEHQGRTLVLKGR